MLQLKNPKIDWWQWISQTCQFCYQFEKDIPVINAKTLCKNFYLIRHYFVSEWKSSDIRKYSFKEQSDYSVLKLKSI